MQYNIIILYNMYKYVYINIRIIYTIINSYMHAALKKGYVLSWISEGTSGSNRSTFAALRPAPNGTRGSVPWLRQMSLEFDRSIVI